MRKHNETRQYSFSQTFEMEPHICGGQHDRAGASDAALHRPMHLVNDVFDDLGFEDEICPFLGVRQPLDDALLELRANREDHKFASVVLDRAAYRAGEALAD